MQTLIDRYKFCYTYSVLYLSSVKLTQKEVGLSLQRERNRSVKDSKNGKKHVSREVLVR